jgi:hypothetical protein
VFWGGCVVFWCSFWVGFWLSESLRGVFTPARNGRLQGSPCEQGGTTALLAAQMGYPATLVEINPFLVWLSRAKTRIYTPDAIQSALEWGQMLVHKRRDYTHSACEPPPIRDIQRWWDAESLAWLTTMRTAIHATQATVAQASADLVWVAFAQCIIEFSNASYHHPSLSFRESRQLALDMQSHDRRFLEYLHETARDAHSNPYLEPCVIEADARTLTPLDGNIYDLVITSPPYANRISYIRELRPYMYWLGFLTDGAEAGELDWRAIGGTWGIATSRLKLWQPQLPVPAQCCRCRFAHSRSASHQRRADGELCREILRGYAPAHSATDQASGVRRNNSLHRGQLIVLRRACACRTDTCRVVRRARL